MKEDAIKFFKVENFRPRSKGKLLKVKINIEDIGVIVQAKNKIRCFKFEVLEDLGDIICDTNE